MREIKFRALFKHISSRELVWLESVINYKISGTSGYVQVTPWLQYTGLKDKNGVEIYDGDICKHDYGIGQVECDNYYFYVDNFYCSSQDNPGDIFSENAEIEVIGNIYENPELLES